MSDQQTVRDHVLWLLRGGDAHVGLAAAIADLPAERRRERPDGLPHSAWEILEHMRLAQEDIVAFSQSADHVTPPFPDGFWPETSAPPSDDAWDRSVEAWRADHRTMEQLVADTERDLFAPFPWGGGQTLLREALVLADHNAYHVGQLVTLRRLLGEWER